MKYGSKPWVALICNSTTFFSPCLITTGFGDVVIVKLGGGMYAHLVKSVISGPPLLTPRKIRLYIYLDKR